MFQSRKAFTLVEMLVALAVSSIVIIATYASYDMVKTQYEKNIDIADTHTSGRAVIRIIERDIRMAGYEHRDSSGDKSFSAGITNKLVLTESDNACCDGVSVIYDQPTDIEDGVERRRITYSVREFPGTEEEIDYRLLDGEVTRYRLYKKIDVLGRGGTILPAEESGTNQVLADFVEDLQFVNIVENNLLYLAGETGVIRKYNITTGVEISPPISITWPNKPSISINDGVLYLAGETGVIRKYNITTGVEISPPISITWPTKPTIAINNESIGKESLVNIKLTLRSKNKQHTADRTYTKEADEEHHIGNYNFEFDDKYKRDVFFSTVAVRNMLL